MTVTVKEAARAAIEDAAEGLVGLSHRIWDHPDLKRQSVNRWEGVPDCAHEFLFTSRTGCLWNRHVGRKATHPRHPTGPEQRDAHRIRRPTLEATLRKTLELDPSNFLTTAAPSGAVFLFQMGFHQGVSCRRSITASQTLVSIMRGCSSSDMSVTIPSSMTRA